MTASMRILAGGAPRPAQAAALASALAAVLDAERAAASAGADPRPAVYRSRWRRAAALDGVHDVRDLRDPSPPWLGTG